MQNSQYRADEMNEISQMPINVASFSTFRLGPSVSFPICPFSFSKWKSSVIICLNNSDVHASSFKQGQLILPCGRCGQAVTGCVVSLYQVWVGVDKRSNGKRTKRNALMMGHYLIGQHGRRTPRTAYLALGTANVHTSPRFTSPCLSWLFSLRYLYHSTVTPTAGCMSSSIL